MHVSERPSHRNEELLKADLIIIKPELVSQELQLFVSFPIGPQSPKSMLSLANQPTKEAQIMLFV